MSKALLPEAVSIIYELLESIDYDDDDLRTARIKSFLKKAEDKKIRKGLSDEQKRFIRSQVKELGSIEKTKKFYDSKSLVCSFALQTAEEFFKEAD